MIKKLRLKFIIIAMVAVILVLSVIISFINASNYVKINDDSDKVLNVLKENGGSFQQQSGNNRPGRNNQLGPEVPAETRYFTIYIDEYGNVNTRSFMVNRITREEANSIAEKVLASNQTRGYYGIYRFYKYNYEDQQLISFVDCSRMLDNAKSFLIASVLTSIGGIIVVFIIIFVASKYIFKPVEDAYLKQTRFISNASHELKTPLTIISANNEIMEMTHGSDESTDAIKRQIKRLNQMVTSLSLLSRLSETNKLSNISSFNVSLMLNDLISDYRFLIDDNKNVEIKIEDDIYYDGDENLFRQLLSIVIDNAIKYSNNNINIMLYKNDNNKIIEVINDCYEIENGNHPEVFERFYRNDNIRSQKEGSGIGLSIAKEISNLHKAKIEASSMNNNFKIKITL